MSDIVAGYRLGIFNFNLTPTFWLLFTKCLQLFGGDAVGRRVPLGVGAHVAADVPEHLPELVDLAHSRPRPPDEVPDISEEVLDTAEEVA